MDGINERRCAVIHITVFIFLLHTGFMYLLIGVYHRVLQSGVYQIFFIGAVYYFEFVVRKLVASRFLNSTAHGVLRLVLKTFAEPAESDV